MLKLPKVKILQNIKHNEEVKKVNSDDKVNKDIINKNHAKINSKNSDPIHSNNKNTKLDIKNFINEHKNNPQNNNNIYESSMKAVNNNVPNVFSFVLVLFIFELNVLIFIVLTRVISLIKLF